jgi:hypothetical protein
MIRWIAGIGAVTAEALADHQSTTLGSSRARLLAAHRQQLLARLQPLAGQPALYTVTRAGLRAGAIRGLEPARVSASNALHMTTCAAVAAALERCYPDHRVLGERELRYLERQRARPLASAYLGTGPGAEARLHRPDLVLLPAAALPIAVEVELTVKGARRLRSICRAWARCRHVAGVLYLAHPDAEPAVRRAVEDADAAARIVVVPLHALPMAAAA